MPWLGLLPAGKSSRRLFGAYRWTEFIALSGRATGLLLAIRKRIEFGRRKSQGLQVLG